MNITGPEASALLFAFDHYFHVIGGEVGEQSVFLKGYTRAELQNLRDRLFAAHEHPPE